MIRSGPGGVDPTRPSDVLRWSPEATFRLGKMGRTAYWNPCVRGLASSVLGDASRGALYLALRPAASNGESPSPPPPERRAPSDSSGVSSESAGAFGAAQSAQGPQREEQHEAERRPVGEA